MQTGRPRNHYHVPRHCSATHLGPEWAAINVISAVMSVLCNHEQLTPAEPERLAAPTRLLTLKVHLGSGIVYLSGKRLALSQMEPDINPVFDNS